MLVSTCDPSTLEFLADQTAQPTGKKRYNPVPRSRVPSYPRPKMPDLSRRSAASPAAMTAPRDPVYLLGVPRGHEFRIARQLHSFSAVTAVILPVDASNQPMLPGSLFVAIPDTVYLQVANQIREQSWGWIQRPEVNHSSGHRTGIATFEEYGPFLRYAATLDDDEPLSDEPPPLRLLAESVLHSRGWHGALSDQGWALRDVHGAPLVNAEFHALWQSLSDAWKAHQPLATILREHGPALTGVAFPFTLTHTPRQGDWSGEWLGQPIVVPAAEHRNIRLRGASVWGVLLSHHPLQFSLRHPDLPRQRLRHRVPYQDVVRDPGHWAAVLVPQVTDSIRSQLQRSAHSLGWTEPWHAVSATDPVHLVRTLLRPREVHLRASTRRIEMVGVASERSPWTARAETWLPDWLLQAR